MRKLFNFIFLLVVVCAGNAQNIEIDSVVFSYFPFENDDLRPYKFKLYDSTLFVSTFLIHGDVSNDTSYLKETPVRKITDDDTLNLIFNFVQKFIVDKTDKIVIKDHEQVWETDYTLIRIRAYRNEEVVYYEYIIFYPEREYNPIFLQLCDFFYNIALESGTQTPNE